MSGESQAERPMRRFEVTVLTLLLLSICASASWGGVNCVADAAGCCCIGARGNVDCDNKDIVDIADLTLLIDHLYITYTPLPSVDEANVDGEDGIDIADITRLINFMYIKFDPLPPCPGAVNHPPVTILTASLADSIWINSTGPGQPGTPIPVSWGGDDRLDHPYEEPQLHFEWRLYGPYDSVTYAAIRSQFVKRVFVTPLGQMHYFGQGDSIIICDTLWIPDAPTWPTIVCQTVLIDNLTSSNSLGTIDTILDVSATAFKYNQTYNKVALSSGNVSDPTVTDTTDTLYNLFHNEMSDSTVGRYFMFWVRAYDFDNASLVDPAPPFQMLFVTDPKFERDVLIADAELSYEINPRNGAKAKAYWNAAIPRWNPVATPDFLTISQPTGNVLPLATLLEHKIIVVVNDEVIPGVTVTSDIRRNLLSALKAGANVWFCGRSQFYGGENTPPKLHARASSYGADKFGMTELCSTGWSYYDYKDPSVRIEDFCGATAVDSTAWPNLVIDTAYLHQRYGWGGDAFPPWMPSLAALPEVDYWSFVPQAENLYTYRSIYTDHHPLVPDSFFFAGKPVVSRLTQGYSRLMFSAFTPYAMSGDSTGGAAQVFIDSVMNWLSEPFVAGTEHSTAATPAISGKSKESKKTAPPDVVGVVGGKKR
jgi:hypothetical protein